MKPSNVADPGYFHKVVDCQWACPAHTPVPQYIRLIAGGRYGDAYLVNWRSNVFPGILGRVCDRPCEPACRRGRIDEEPVAICRLKRVAADMKEDISARLPVAPPQKNGKRVACIGGGPASLTVARDLALAGYAVTVFDNAASAGGMMRSQIPKFRLPEVVIDEEVDYVLGLGVELKNNHWVTSLKDMVAEEWDAIFVGTGAPRGRDADLPGRAEAAAQTHVGIDWLSSVAFGHVTAIAPRVIVLGGGNTAMDCCRTAKRLGGVEVNVVVRSGFDEMKASPWEKEDALHEGIGIHNFLVPKEFKHDAGKLTGVLFEKVHAKYDEGGRRSLVPTGEADVLMACDAVLVAIGQENSFPWVERDIGVDFDKHGMPRVNATTLQSTLPRVFFGGDAGLGPKNIITAVAQGHEAAISIDLFCQGQDVAQRPPPMTTLASQKMGIHEWSYDNQVSEEDRHRVPMRPLEVALKDVRTELELGFDVKLAFQEAERCLNCDVETVFTSHTCIECDACADICPTLCITFTDNGEEDDLRGRLKAPARNLDQDLYVSDTLKTGRVMVKDEDVCLHCGMCAERCPTGAWDMQAFYLEMAQAAGEQSMKPIQHVNEFVIKFANVNGSGSASANELFARAILRMGVTVSPRNIFPSNIQGMPTWYEMRVSAAGWLGRRGGCDLMVAMNPQTWDRDVAEIEPGGYLFYDSTKPLPASKFRDDISVIGIPLTELCNRSYSDPRQRQLFKNIMYVGALTALLDLEMAEVEKLISEQYAGKGKLIAPNVHALKIGFDYAKEHFECPIALRVERADAVGERIFIDGNSAAGLGAVYGGATVCAWYPITPSTSVVEAFTKYAGQYRKDAEHGGSKVAIVQAEDELASIGIVVGAGWNGSRAFTATSGPGISLMQEFLGLAYFAEIPAVVIDVQRGGPSTGMPTRTQQSDLLSAAYASHGDTRHLLLFPQDPNECFEFAALSFDLAERLQTPVFVMTDLDIGMNERLTKPFAWDDRREYDRGKVMSAADLDSGKEFGRYKDVDGDGIPWRTIPGTHPTKGAFFTRGTTRNPYAKYSETGADYLYNMERLRRKLDTAAELAPAPELQAANEVTRIGVIYYGSTAPAMDEAIAALQDDGIQVDRLRLRAFPFAKSVFDFIASHDHLFVVEQNESAQLRQLLVNEGEIDPKKLVKVLHYDGTPITARFIAGRIADTLSDRKITPLRKVVS